MLRTFLAVIATTVTAPQVQAQARAADSAAGSRAVRVRVAITGIEGPVRDNVQALLGLSAAARSGDTVATVRLRRLYDRAPQEIALAMQPFGYYQPTVTSTLDTVATRWSATFAIDPGPRTMVQRVAVTVTGPGAADSVIQTAVADFPLVRGDPLRHPAYTRGKAALAQAAVNRGYLEARFDSAQISVDRVAAEADIVLQLSTGPQFTFGDVTIRQDVVDPRILQGYVTITPGEPFDRRRLRDVQARLNATSYFAQVDVRAERDSTDGRRIPVTIVLTPRRSQRFNVGVGYGTNTNLRVTFNAEFRRLNRRGHHADLNLRVSGIEKSMSARYSMPPPYPRTRQLDLFTGLALLDPVSYNTNKFVLGTDLSRTKGRRRETVSLAYSWEDYVVGAVDTGISKLVIASANVTHVAADNKIFAWRGTQVGVMMRGAVEELLSNASFFEVTIPAKAIVPFLSAGRLITRAELGYLVSNRFRELPPTVRFFTGGDRSVRGYEYLSLGGRDDAGNIIGGDVLVAVSAEANYFFYGDFGASLFYDAGDAPLGLGSLSLFHGTGFGVRWRSPIGPIGLDLAWALSLPGDPTRVHITLGPDF
jgi:translocation and assembly module TamA